MLVYVDDIIHLAPDTKDNMYALNHAYILNEENVGTPKRYIGANIKTFQMKNEKE